MLSAAEQSGAGYVHRAVAAAWGRPAGTRLPRRRLDRIRPGCIGRILRIANAIGNAAAHSSAMAQIARGPSAP
jgi:hypothetical protein